MAHEHGIMKSSTLQVVASYVEPYLKNFKTLLQHPKFIEGDWTPTAGRPGQPISVRLKRHTVELAKGLECTGLEQLIWCCLSCAARAANTM